MKLFQLEALLRHLCSEGCTGDTEIRVQTSENRPTRPLTELTIHDAGEKIFLHAPEMKKRAKSSSR